MLNLLYPPHVVTTENVYQTFTLGIPKFDVKGKRAKRLITAKDLKDSVLSNKAKCCRSQNCISKWKEDLPKDKVEAIIVTERNAYAKMSEPVRKLHYMTMLKQLLVPVYATVSSTEKVLTGEKGEGVIT